MSRHRSNLPKMRAVQCPDLACGHRGEPVRGRERATTRGLWLCEMCRGRLPVTTPPQRKRPRDDEEAHT